MFPRAPRTGRLNLAAGLLLIHDFWDASHEAAQEADDLGERDFSAYWHGIAHRREPDAGNANYWFRRVGRHPVFSSLAEEARPLLEEHGDAQLTSRLASGGWNASAMIDLCTQAGAGTPRETLRPTASAAGDVAFARGDVRGAGRRFAFVILALCATIVPAGESADQPIERSRRRFAMATDLHPSETLALDELDSETAKFYEAVNGRIEENPPMGALESFMANYLGRLMGPFAYSHNLGTVVIETLFLLDSTRRLKRRPDLAFVSTQRWPLKRRLPRTECWEIVPDLVAEFISETNTADKVVKKIDEYFHAGVSAVWVVYPGRARSMSTTHRPKFAFSRLATTSTAQRSFRVSASRCRCCLKRVRRDRSEGV